MENKFLEERKSILSTGEPDAVKRDQHFKKEFRWSRRRVLSLLMLLVVVYIFTVTVSNYLTIRRYKAENQRLMEQLAQADVEIEELNAYIENAQDPVFIEKMARENLKMVRPDETVYLVVK